MPQRNGYKSHNGRSGTARKVQFGGASGTNGIMPGVNVTTTTGQVVRTRYFGGPKKGGLQPSATGFMIASSSTQAFNPPPTIAGNKNFLFNFRQNYSPNASQPGAGGPLL